MTNILDTDLAQVVNPLAQTIRLLDKSCYITSIGLYFRYKPNTAISGVQNLPVIIELRPVDNGYPISDKFYQGSRVSKLPATVLVSEDASVETRFTFPVPVFIEEGTEFAICVYTNAPQTTNKQYTIWQAKLDEFVLGSSSTKKYASQSEAGVIFKSSNGTVWEPDQFSDLKLNVYRAKFTNTDAVARLITTSPPPKLLESDPLSFTNNDSDVYVRQPGHGFQVGDYARIYKTTGVLDSATVVAGITGVNLFGYRPVVFADNQGYVIKAGTKATSTRRAGGNGITADRHIKMDFLSPQITTFTPEYTDYFIRGDFTTTKSYASYPGEQTNYTAFADAKLINKEEQSFGKPFILPTDRNRDAFLAGLPATKIDAVLLSNDQLQHAIINLDQTRMIAITNDIDYQQDSNADYQNMNTILDGYNRPWTYVSETNKNGGSHRSRYITKPITLLNPAVGLKVFVDACRPLDTDFDLYFRTLPSTSDSDMAMNAWAKADITPPNSNYTDLNPVSNQDDYREYQFMIGGAYAGTLAEFDQYQLKFILKSRNTAYMPTLKNLRTIALAD
jgi:hypothetical protein